MKKQIDALDWWSIAHFLGGACLGIFFTLFDFLFYGLFISALGMILWEYYEYKTGIKESWRNRIADVLIGVFGYMVFLSIVI
jgi:hypothetical protein